MLSTWKHEIEGSKRERDCRIEERETLSEKAVNQMGNPRDEAPTRKTGKLSA